MKKMNLNFEDSTISTVQNNEILLSGQKLKKHIKNGIDPYILCPIIPEKCTQSLFPSFSEE